MRRANRTRGFSTARSFATLCHRNRSRCRRCARPGTGRASRDSDCTKSFRDFVLMIPDCPRGTAPAEEIFKVLLFFESIHAGPIAVVWIDHQPAGANEPPERFFYEFLAVLHVTEDLLPQHHEPPVHPRPGLRDVLDARNDATGLHGDKM